MIVERSMDPRWLSNAYLVADREGGAAVYVDSGAPLEPLTAAAERWGVRPSHVLRTHGDLDHVEHEEELGLPVVTGPLEVFTSANRFIDGALESYDFERIVGASDPLQRVLAVVRKVAKSNSTVLIRGETGTGKELIAGAIHHNSLRAARNFVKVNCAALQENLLESELFGHEKAAYRPV